MEKQPKAPFMISEDTPSICLVGEMGRGMSVAYHNMVYQYHRAGYKIAHLNDGINDFKDIF